jgi:YihY family inner membrane protein
MQKFRAGCKLSLQEIIFAAERFGQHEMANHASAGAYAFLLSATPAVMLVMGLASTLLGRSPRILALVTGLIADALGPLGTVNSVNGFFASRLDTLAIIVGGVSLVWAARLFFVTVQRGIRLIYAASGRNKAVKDNLLIFALEFLCLVAIVAILAATEALELLFELPRFETGDPLVESVRAVLNTAPALALFAFVYLTYLFIPPAKPRRATVALSALLCLVAFALFSEALRAVTDSTHYQLLYGVFWRLVVLLVNVYAFFTLYFYCAELAYVRDHFDALLFGRFYRLSRAPKAGRLERRLFMDPGRLVAVYGKRFAAGETVFSEGSEGHSVYYVRSGAIGIYIKAEEGERELNRLGPNEMFGEMAAFLGETRSATARADEDSLVLELPPEAFDLVLRTDGDAMRGLADSLSARLKEANGRLVD